ncbi:MAG: hypothetical protein SH850_11905 [Planctomycetaceae bacterium]|nr:hypothetical protein [Planctomycetaceae bacterium]
MPTIGGTSGSQKSLHCPYCGRDTLHESMLWHSGGILTLLTCGLFLPFWIIAHFFSAHYRCQTCGKTRRAYGAPRPTPAPASINEPRTVPIIQPTAVATRRPAATANKPDSTASALLKFNCPHCGKSIKVQRAAAGKKGKCPGCSKSIDVPRATELTDDDLVEPMLWEKARDRYATLSKNQQVFVVLVAVAVPLFCLVPLLPKSPKPEPVVAPTQSTTIPQMEAAPILADDAPNPIVKAQDTKAPMEPKPAKLADVAAEIEKLRSRLSVVENHYLDLCLKNGGKVPKLNLDEPTKLKTDEIGLPSFTGEGLEVNTVINDEEMLIAGNTLWVKGFRTDGLVSDATVTLPKVVIVAGTKTYSTVLGGSRTVKYLIAIDTRTPDLILERIQRLKEFRNWTDVAADLIQVARFISVADGVAHLQPFAVGGEIEIPMDRLSEEDQRWIQGELSRRNGDFVGRWTIVDNKGVTATYFTLTKEHGAQKSHAPDVAATWEIVGSDARITWDDGWKVILRPQDGNVLTFAFSPGTTWDDAPDNTYRAIKQK